MLNPKLISETSPKPIVLVIENDKTNARLACLILEKGGYGSDVASNGREGVEAARQKLFDVILMDIHMPVLSGFEAAREIRQFPGWAGRVPIIALTASISAKDARQCFEAGMDDYMAKPLKITALIEKCQYWMNRRPLANQYVERAAKGTT